MEFLTPEEVQQRIEPLARKIFEAKKMDLVELTVKGRPNDIYIQVLADKPSGGITIGECVILNKSLVAAIEVENFLPREIFSLEVSSPGIDYPRVKKINSN